MKPCSTDLETYLNTKTEFKCCNLYKIVLQDGYTLFITDYDRDVVFENHTFKHDYCIMERGQTKTSGTPEVDTLSFNLYADRNHDDLVNNTFILEAIHKGLFDTAYITLWRAFFDATIDGQTRPYGAIKQFVGRLELSSCNNVSAKFSAKSETTGLNALIPIRTFQAQSSYCNNNGSVVESSTDRTTCAIPLKPSGNVLYQFGLVKV